jgi:hypothetical protein
MADCALAPAINKAAQVDKAPVPAKPRLKCVKLAFNLLVTNINSAMENGKCGTLGNKTSPPNWKYICTTKYQLWKRQFDTPVQTNNCNNPPGGGGGGGGDAGKKSDASK